MSPVLFLSILTAVAAAVVVTAVLVRRYELSQVTRLRRAAEESAQTSSRELRDLKYAIDQASIIATTDQTGRITYVNDNFCTIAKYSREELLGQDHRVINSAYHPPEFIRDLWRTIASGRVWKGEIRNRAKDGTFYWVDTTIVPFLNERGKPYQYLAIRNDITARKNAEALLVAQASMARLGELAAVVAHEVRNPLAGIRGALQVLQQRSTPNTSDASVIGEMIRRLDVLSDRVSDLLLYAKPRAPRIGPVELRRLLETTAELLRRDPALARVRVEIAGPDVSARGDAELLREVCLNLLLNAAQAMEGRGTISVTLAAADRAVVTIRDEGPGIPLEQREIVFEPFFTTKRSGTGLGLAIVRRLVELQGGTVTLEPPGGGGATVVVQLPCDAASPPSLAPTGPASSGEASANVTPDPPVPLLDA